MKDLARSPKSTPDQWTRLDYIKNSLGLLQALIVILPASASVLATLAFDRFKVVVWASTIKGIVLNLLATCVLVAVVYASLGIIRNLTANFWRTAPVVANRKKSNADGLLKNSNIVAKSGEILFALIFVMMFLLCLMQARSLFIDRYHFYSVDHDDSLRSDIKAEAEFYIEDGQFRAAKAIYQQAVEYGGIETDSLKHQVLLLGNFLSYSEMMKKRALDHGQRFGNDRETFFMLVEALRTNPGNDDLLAQINAIQQQLDSAKPHLSALFQDCQTKSLSTISEFDRVGAIVFEKDVLASIKGQSRITPQEFVAEICSDVSGADVEQFVESVYSSWERDLLYPAIELSRRDPDGRRKFSHGVFSKTPAEQVGHDILGSSADTYLRSFLRTAMLPFRTLGTMVPGIAVDRSGEKCRALSDVNVELPCVDAADLETALINRANGYERAPTH